MIGLSNKTAIRLLDEFLLDCKYISEDERSEIMEQVVLVREA